MARFPVDAENGPEIPSDGEPIGIVRSAGRHIDRYDRQTLNNRYRPHFGHAQIACLLATFAQFEAGVRFSRIRAEAAAVPVFVQCVLQQQP
ncbi:MAG: hypothetical protein ACKOWG_10905 [Planctomycetia bacterium]